jgi:HAD superfamily hydrolase (TIGR01549 family)
MVGANGVNIANTVIGVDKEIGTLRRPKALLLDFGGVIVDAPALPHAPVELVDRLHELIGGAVSVDRIRQNLIDGARSYAQWRNDESERNRPRELSHAQVLDDFVTLTWPDAARERARHEATALCYAWAYRADWAILPGICELLDAADAAGLPAAVVSNTLCGAAHRDFLAGAGMSGRFTVQLYSDEIGIRKPNPEMAWTAARELGLAIADCWFIGDSLSRDVACARRASCGGAVLVRSARTGREVGSGMEPDLTVENAEELCDVVAGYL